MQYVPAEKETTKGVIIELKIRNKSHINPDKSHRSRSALFLSSDAERFCLIFFPIIKSSHGEVFGQ